MKYLLFIFFVVSGIVAIGQNPGDKVLSINMDEFGHLWIGTDQGLLLKNGDKFQAFYSSPATPGTVNDIEFQQLANGKVIWLASLNGLTQASYSAKGINASSFFNKEITKFETDVIQAITFDNKNVAFFSTPAGIGLYTGSEWKFMNEITDIYRNKFTSTRAKGDTIYVGTKGEGVGRIVKDEVDGYTGATSLLAPWSSLVANNINCIFVDSKGYRWFGTDKGLSRHTKFDAKEGWEFNVTDQLPHLFVSCLAEDASGNLWIGTSGGLAILDNTLKVSKTIKVADGLPSDQINDIYIDKNGLVYIGTNLGLAIIKGSNISVIKTSDYTKNFIETYK
jgi:ligand-binding sensor domain-containing protein